MAEREKIIKLDILYRGILYKRILVRENQINIFLVQK